MESPPAHTVLCSSCSRRPTESPLYKTCPACRQKAHRQRLRRRLRTTGASEALTSLSTVQSLPPSTSSPSPIQRTLCSNCGRPWQSPRFKTCLRCRQRRQNYSRLATVTERLSSTDIADDSQIDFSALNIFRSAGATHSSPILRPISSSQRILQTQTPHDALRQAIDLLCDEYDRHVVASRSFPPDISASDIRKSVSRYDEETSTAAKASVCGSCGRFVLHADIHHMDDEDPLLLPLSGLLDHCGRHARSWTLCSSCHRALSRAAIPKFSAKNLVNVTLCQNYPSVLEGLTLTEEYAIARCHPVGLIVKLRPGGRWSSVSHRALRGHFIVLPQDPGPLLQILPSVELRLDNLIKVFWLGNHSPSDADLRPYLVIRKQRVLAALQYLVRYNHLYRGFTINQPMMEDWSDEFIPRELRDNIIRLDGPDHHEREGYTVSLAQGNYENDLQAAQDEAAQDQSFDPDDGTHFLTGSVSTDINGERQNPDARMLNTLLDVVTNGSRPSDQCDIQNPNSIDRRSISGQRIPAISYRTRALVPLMDHWLDPHYFTAAFPTLFPNGIGGHLNERIIPVSLSSFAEWALNHHSRRWADST